MRLPANIGYFFKSKKNHLLPDVFNDYILDMSVGNYACRDAENYRNDLLKCDSKLQITDFGAGSHKLGNKTRIIKDIAAVSGTKPEFGMFFIKLINSFGIKNILEMGTSVGIGTFYLSQAAPGISLTGIEACPQTADFVKHKLAENKISNVEIINDDFDSVFAKETLPQNHFDLVYIDGNHRGEALLKYYEILRSKYLSKQHIIIADDINWSRDMFAAWEKIVESASDTYLDLFRCGIILSGYELPKGLFSINFVKNWSE
jgi:predicted O-methyltransferase YrrM